MLGILLVAAAVLAVAEADCTLYQDEGWGGRIAVLARHQRMPKLSDWDFNDRTTSTRTVGGCVIRAWEHRDYRGYSREFGTQRNIGSLWNDEISSAWCVCS